MIFKGTKVVGLFESWPAREMFAECMRELGCERTQPQVKQGVRQPAVAGVQPASARAHVPRRVLATRPGCLGDPVAQGKAGWTPATP